MINTDSTYELVVVGGGISGLGFAHMARKRGIRTLLLEAGSKLGGCINSQQFAIKDGHFWAELGAHTCYNSYGNLLQILEDTQQLGLLQEKRKLKYQVQTSDGLKSIFSQLNIYELLGVLPRLWMTRKQGKSVSEYYGRIIGSRNFESVLGPALDAVVCQPAGDFPADAIFRKKPRRKDVMRSYTGPSGLQSFVDGIANQSSLDIRIDSEVSRIQCASDGCTVEIKGGKPLNASHVALALAPDVAARLIVASMPQLADLLSKVAMAEIETVAVLIDAASSHLPLLAGIIGRDDDFYSVVSRDLVPQDNYRAFTFHFRPNRLDEAGKLSRICQVLEVDQSAVLDYSVTSNRLPALRTGHEDLTQEVDKQLAGMPLAMTGNWFSGVSIEDSLIRSAEEFARSFPQ